MATLFDSASLVMVPSGYKDDKLYSIKPTNGDGDFTFSRDGSGASPATRVNSAGNIEKGRENLLLQSNQFDITWTANNATGMSGYPGYDGTNDAWELEATWTSDCRINQSISGSGVQCISIYAKANTSDFLAINAIVTGTNTIAYFDLANGVVGTTGGAPIDANIESVGNGWYRCSLVFNDTNTEMRFLIADGDGSTAVTNGNSIYIQDAQLESGLVATDYIETTTAPVSAGLLGDMPRLDYSGGATCPSLLLEPSRSNLITQSEYYGAWTASNANVTANATTSPEGLQNAAEIEFTASSAKIYDQFTNVASSMHIGSVWLKNKDIGSIRVRIEGGGPAILGRVDVNLANGTLSNAVGDFTPTIEDFGNGWYRVAVGDTSNATIGSPSFNLDYLSSTGSFYAYGAQVEAASYVSSYIPTYGSASTRGADACNGAGDSSTFNDTEGVLFVELEALAEDSTYRFISVSDGTTTNRVNILLNNDNTLRAFVSGVGTLTSSVSITQNNKAAIKYKSGDYAFWVNGTEVATNTSTSGTHTGLDALAFDIGNGSNDFYGKVKQAIYLPTALTDTELAALTTL